MKRFTIPLFAFIFAVALVFQTPSTIHAETNSNGAIQEKIGKTLENLLTTQKEQKNDGKVKLDIEDVNTKKNELRAILENGKKAKGTWTYYINGDKKGTKKHSRTSMIIPLDYEFGEELDVKVDFSGKVDGKKMNLTDTFEIFGLKVSYDNSIKGKDKFTINVTNIDKAHGDWKVKVKDQQDKVVDQYSKDNVDGLEFSHAFPNFKPGKYKVHFYFEGQMHDYERDVIEFNYYQLIDVKKDPPQKPDEDENKPEPNVPETPSPSDPGTGNPEPEPEPGNETPTTPDENKDNNQPDKEDGGPLPNTATNLPFIFAIGAALLIIGFVVLRFKKNTR